MPAKGGAIVLSPGINFASTRECGPCLRKKVSVFLTQESGSSAMRQSQSRTCRPRRLPNSNQIQSATRAADTVTLSATQRFIYPDPASTPAATNTGIAGIGRPIFSTKTTAKSTIAPFCLRNSIASFMIFFLHVVQHLSMQESNDHSLVAIIVFIQELPDDTTVSELLMI